MFKKYTILIIISLIIIVGFSISHFLRKSPKITGGSRCQFKEMVFYYLDTCIWCQKVKNEGTINKIEKLGVKVRQIDANLGPIKHQFTGVPTFVIDEKVYSGYKTFDELKKLLRCSTVNRQVPNLEITKSNIKI